MSTSSRAVVLAFALALAVWLLYLIRGALILIYISVVFAVVLTPAADAVQRLRIRGWSPGRGSAVLLIFAGTILAIALFLLFALPPIIGDIEQLIAALPDRASRWQVWLGEIPFLPAMTPETLKGYIGSLVTRVTSVVTSAFTIAASVASVVLLTAYMILDGGRLLDWSMLLVPPGTRSTLDPALRRAAAGMRKWLVGQAFLMLILGSSSAIVFGLLRVRYFYVLAVFAGVANIFPMIGPIVTVIVASLVAAIDSYTKLIGVLIYFLVYQQVENVYLTPHIMQAQVKISGTAVLIALLVGAEFAGVAGALVAVPSAMLIITLLEYYIVEPQTGPTRMP